MPTLSPDESSDTAVSVPQLIGRVRRGDADSLGALLQLYRGYLSVLAATRLDQRLRPRLNPSDLVQETMLAAHRDFPSFRGNSEGEWLTWLRQILCNCVSHAVEAHVLAQKRDVRREVRLDPQIDVSGDGPIGLINVLAAAGDTPSRDAGRKEIALRLTQQLDRLKPDYRQVIVYRNLEGLSFDDIAQRMGRKPGTVRMLWVRAIERFKTVCDSPAF
ncbi:MULTISPECIES: sigma-70 family RNA polymerase sigma factor [Crateriforma]|uniref:ECF RNA polymerase sigma-E factor n=1 Tax=Crateriforma conspicua TaxID=2527996 RepID=A0A5C6FUN6_9PLAN|nr:MULTISPECIES: sigma-70 family RNA polymerase sigma factor [Crateriforma]QDV63975.1 ECF RNA polymerase sigma-E factor [Crateriforma conspicua]TWT69336.1 ECF RNA polymerase sigma-E factor [Crateriforma conspicua]TWU66697.1 ECF RNA polymerase sigma-E factor [Crateriforma conspicua]